MAFDPVLAKRTVALCRYAYRSADQAEQALTALGLHDFLFESGLGTQAVVAQDDDYVYVAFRGSEAIEDWLTNAKFLPSTREQGVRIHTGFIDALDEVWDEIQVAVVAAAKPAVLTGHSLGAALASLAALRLTNGISPVAAVYTYGQPRTGHGDFRSLYDAALGDVTYRFVNHVDLVARVPLLLQGYRHVGHRMYFDEQGELHPDASGWSIAADDLRYRLRHAGKISSIGMQPHLISPYQARVEAL